MSQKDVIKHSVTRADFKDAMQGAIAISSHLDYLHFAGWQGVDLDIQRRLPLGWSRGKDLLLKKSVYFHFGWRNAVTMAASKFASHDFQIDSKFNTRLEQAQSLCLTANYGSGWTPFLTQICYDFLLTGNNYIVEIVRSSNSVGSRILGMVTLDTTRCTRTDDAMYPILYEDKNGKQHKLAYHQVMFGEDNRGVPASSMTCAAEAAWSTIYKMAVFEAKISERESGKHFRRVHFVSNMTEDIIDDSVENAVEKRKAAGHTYYRGDLVIPLATDQRVTVDTIDLIDLPPDKHVENERMRADLDYANAVGLNPKELNPALTSRSSLDGGKADMNQEEQARSRGLHGLIKNLTHNLNTKVMPSATTFSMAAPNVKDKIVNEDLREKRMKNVAMLVDKFGLAEAQALNILADNGDVPTEFAQPDLTDGGSVTDTSTATKEVATKEHEDSVFVGYFMSVDDSAEIALSGDGAADIGSHHITLLYAGKSGDVNLDQADFLDAVKVWAASAEAIQFTLNGIGVFFNEETWPLWGQVQSAEIWSLQQSLVEALQNAGLEYEDERGFTPHVTLAYLEPNASIPTVSLPDKTYTLDSVRVSYGTRIETFDLGETS